MSWEDEDGKPKTKLEAHLAGGGAHLFDGTHVGTFGSSSDLDLRALLGASQQARYALSQLTLQERFVLTGYFLLKKPQCLLGEMVGLNECRIKQFLDLTLQRFSALAAFCYLLPEDIDALLVESGYGLLKAKPGLDGKVVKGMPEIEVSTSSVLFLLEAGKGWLQIEALTGARYSDLRRAFETAAEKLQANELLIPHLLGTLMMSRVQFAAVKESGGAGRMAAISGTRVRVKDPTILGTTRIKVQEVGENDFFYKRAAFANSGAEPTNEV